MKILRTILGYCLVYAAGFAAAVLIVLGPAVLGNGRTELDEEQHGEVK